MQAKRENVRPLKIIASLVVVALASMPLAWATAGTLKDGADRTVTIPAGVTSVVPAGPPAQALLQALAPGLLGGLVEPFKPEQVIYVDPKIAALPQIPMLSRTDAPGDVAMVAALKPGLCVDYGNVSARYVAATEAIQEELHVPAAIFGGDLANTGAVATALGSALGVDGRAKQIAAAIAEVMARIKPVAELADDARASVYMARGSDGLQAMRAGASFDEPIRLAGGRNVVVASGGPFKRMSIADVVALKPSVVIFAESEALSSPLHDALPKGTIFILDAGEPYKVLTGPPSLNRIIGLEALAVILHPDRVEADPDEIKRLETTLFPIPPGLAVPAPLQVRP